MFNSKKEAFAFYEQERDKLLMSQKYTDVQKYRASNATFLENYIRDLESRVRNMNKTIARHKKRMKKLKKSRSIIQTEYTGPDGKKYSESYIVLCKASKVEKL